MLNTWNVMVCRYCRENRATTAIEYTFIAAGVALAIAVIVFTLGDNIDDVFIELNDIFAGAT